MSGTMRCDDVIRELAAPTAGCDSAALADHLAACPACSHFAERVAHLDHLWEATRPALPSDRAWGVLWTAVCDQLDQPVEVGISVEEEVGRDLIALPVAVSRPWRRWATVVFGLAQAAALLVGFGLMLARAPQETHAAVVAVDIEPGETVLIGDNGQVNRTEIDADVGPSDIDENYAMFNALEAMAKDL